MNTHKQSSSAPRTLSIGGATYDVFMTMGKTNIVDEHIAFKVGSKCPVERVVECCGGGASNTAVGLSRLGMDAAFCGVVGSDQWGEKLLENLKQERVHTESTTIVEGETSSFSIILSLPNGERTILYAAGVNEHLHDTTFDRDALKSVDGVYLNHLCETSCMISDDVVHAILSKPNITLAWNPGGVQIDAGMHAHDASALLKATDILLLNKEEALHFSNTKSIEEAIKALSASGVTYVCITDGKNGTIATDGQKTYHCPILKNVHVVDTTGAGDAFGTAVLWAILRGHSLQTALLSGTLNAASVVRTIGAQAGLLTETQILAQLHQDLLSVETLH